MIIIIYHISNKQRMDKQHLLGIVDRIIEKYENDDKIDTDDSMFKFFKIIKYPERYIPKEDEYVHAGFTRDYGIIHKIPNKGIEWENLVYLEHIIISFIYQHNDYELFFPNEIKSDEEIEFTLRRLNEKQYLKGLATSLRKSDTKLASRNLLNRFIHCDDKDEDMPIKFRGQYNIFSGPWTGEKLLSAQDMLIDIFIENKHLMPLIEKGIVKSTYEVQLREYYYQTLSDLLRHQTIELGHIKTLLRVNGDWSQELDKLTDLKGLPDVTFDLYDIISKSEAYDHTLKHVNERWAFKNNKMVAADVKFIEKERKKRKNNIQSAQDGIRSFYRNPGFKSSMDL